MPGGRERDLRAIARAESLSDRHRRHAGDLAVRVDDGPRRALRARHLTVDEEILERLRSAEPGRPHAVARPPWPHGHLDSQRRRVEHLVALVAAVRLDPPRAEYGAAGDR